MIKMEQLYYLTLVAKYNSINKAAESLYMSSAAISTSIKQMEKECGYEIIERTYRGVKLTENGKRVVTIAETILSLHDDIMELAKEKDEVVEKYKLAIERSTFKLLKDKIVGPRSKVLEHFSLTEVNGVGMDYFNVLDENDILIMIFSKKERKILENDDRISIRYLYASKVYPISSKNTKFIKNNRTYITIEEFESLPKIRIRSGLVNLENNIVLETDDTSIYSDAILNDYGVGLILNFAPDIGSIDSDMFKIYEPFDEERYVAIISRKSHNTDLVQLLETLIK